MAHKLAVVSVYAPHDRAHPFAVRRGGPVPALHATILYNRADGSLGRCRVNDVCWSYYPDGSTAADVYTEQFLADRRRDEAAGGAAPDQVQDGGRG